MAPQERTPCCEEEPRQSTPIENNLSNIDLSGSFVNKGYTNDPGDSADSVASTKRVTDDGEKRKKVTDFDDLLPYVGEFGMYQKILFLLMIPFAFFVSFVYFSQIFMTIVPEQHWCWIPELANLTVEGSGLHIDNLSFPLLCLGSCKKKLKYYLWSVTMGLKEGSGRRKEPGRKVECGTPYKRPMSSSGCLSDGMMRMMNEGGMKKNSNSPFCGGGHLGPMFIKHT
ncbi:jg23394 [Pararge aegeria aegeria]|uniref:Jg23394 protein n=1 Tax=Pararge aegeria aegeria TaxID=348720 RepID=A0A8S4RIA6_9NEOP|nr:jg23394 [Pararge aegeria aegeria]